MDSQSYSRLQAIVEEALGAPDPAERVRELCSADAEFETRALEFLRLMEDDGGAFSDADVALQRARLDGAVDTGEDPDGWAPESIGRYRVVRQLGRGGTGVVFLAQQASPERLVAVKLIHPLLATPGTVERLRREAEILGSLNHPGIAQIFEAGSADLGFGPQPFLAMEWIDGCDVVQHCARADRGSPAAGGAPVGQGQDSVGPLVERANQRTRVELIVRIADALTHAHARGVVHRDLKPENILVGADGAPKILDFGIAGLRDADGSGGITLDSDILGTLAYMAPEQARGGRSTSPSADVFSLGAIAYELVTGRRPRRIEGLSVTEVLRELTETTPPLARAVAPGVPRDLETVLAKALESEPGRRYGSVGAFRTDLLRFLEHRPVSARPPSAVDHAWKFVRRHPTLVGGAAATLLTLLAGVVVALLLAGRARRAERDAQFESYAAEMLVGTGRITDTVLRGRSKEISERWAPGTELGDAVDARTSGRWEWHLLQSVDREQVLELQVDSPTDVDWSSDGSTIALAHWSGAMVCDARTGETLHELELDLESGWFVSDIRWDPAGDSLVLAGAGLLARWRPGVSSELDWHTFIPFGAAVEFAEDQGETFVVTLGKDAGLFRLTDGERVRTYAGGLAQMTRIDVSKDGREVLACVDAFHGPIVWLNPLTDARRDAGFWIPRRPTAFAMSHGGDRIASVNRGGDLYVLNAVTGEPMVEVLLHDELAFDVAWSPDDSMLASVSNDRTVRIVDPTDGTEIDVLEAHKASVRKVAWSPDGTRVATTSWGGSALISNLAARSAVREVVRGRFHSYADEGQLTVSADFRRLLVSRRLECSVFDVTQERLAGGDPIPGKGFLSPDGKRVAVQAGCKRVVLYSADDGAQLRTIEVEEGTAVISVSWHPSSASLVAANGTGVYVVPTPEGAGAQGPQTKLYERHGQVRAVRHDPSGARAAVFWTDGTLTVTDLASGETLEVQLPSPGGGTVLAWSPCGGRLAAACADQDLWIVDAVTGASLGVLEGHAHEVDSVAWHPGGHRIASASRDRTVKLWDVDNFVQVGSLPHDRRVADALWLHGGRVLATLDATGNILFFDATRSLARTETGAAGVRR